MAMDAELEINNLKNAVAQLNADLLITQQFVAHYAIQSVAQLCADSIKDLQSENTTIIAQLTSDEGKALSEIKSTEKPLIVATQFSDKWLKKLKDLGIPTVIV